MMSPNKCPHRQAGYLNVEMRLFTVLISSLNISEECCKTVIRFIAKHVFKQRTLEPCTSSNVMLWMTFWTLVHYFRTSELLIHRFCKIFLLSTLLFYQEYILKAPNLACLPLKLKLRSFPPCLETLLTKQKKLSLNLKILTFPKINFFFLPSVHFLLSFLH